MRLALVMSHAERRMEGARRELHWLAALRRAGVQAKLFRMHGGVAEDATFLDDAVPASFLPADESSLPNRVRSSAALVAAVAAFAPTLMLFKGLGYRINGELAEALAPCPFGLIVGGATTDPILRDASLVLAEHEAQVAKHFALHQAAGRTLILPKFFDAALAADTTLRPEPEPRFAIINVGSFDDGRKNQTALLGLARRHRMLLVGGGALLETVKANAHWHARFLGAQRPDNVYRHLHDARLMVHPSLHDGLPRAIVEAMACGLPVVAYRAVIQDGIQHGVTGLLVDPDTLDAQVESLLADPDRLASMGQAARDHAWANHGPEAIARAATTFLDQAETLRLG